MAAPVSSASSASAARYDAKALLVFAHTLLERAGLAPDRARDVAEVLLEGDLLGHTTHGLALLPAYLGALANGGMEKSGEPRVLADHDAALTWDGRLLPGPWVVRRAIAEARARLARHAVVSVAIRRSHHIACLQAYLKPVTDAGLFVLLTCSDPAARHVAPNGGVEARFSPNPIGAGIPTDGDPILIDVSMSTTAFGQCIRAAKSGERLPGPWLVDRDGNPTDDPRPLVEQKQGALYPLGGADLGHKGFALALIVEALTSGLAGYGRADGAKEWGASVFLQLIDPERFGGRAAFAREMGFLARSCRDSATPPGKPPVRVPGDGALARRAEQLERGVALHASILPSLEPWAKKFAVPPPL
jgi:L-lactate dehydrogenase